MRNDVKNKHILLDFNLFYATETSGRLEEAEVSLLSFTKMVIHKLIAQAYSELLINEKIEKKTIFYLSDTASELTEDGEELVVELAQTILLKDKELYYCNETLFESKATQIDSLSRIILKDDGDVVISHTKLDYKVEDNTSKFELIEPILKTVKGSKNSDEIREEVATTIQFYSENRVKFWSSTVDPKFLMPRVEGEEVFSFIKKQTEFNLDLRLYMFLEACKATKSFYEKTGKIHTDIKPQNMIWNHENQKMTLIDFADAVKPGTTYCFPIGTRFFYPPEFVEGKHEINFAKSVYALAVTGGLFLDFDSENIQDWRAHCRDVRAVRLKAFFNSEDFLTKLRPQLAVEDYKALDEFFFKMMSPSPSTRTTLDEAISELQLIVNNRRERIFASENYNSSQNIYIALNEAQTIISKLFLTEVQDEQVHGFRSGLNFLKGRLEHILRFPHLLTASTFQSTCEEIDHFIHSAKESYPLIASKLLSTYDLIHSSSDLAPKIEPCTFG